MKVFTIIVLFILCSQFIISKQSEAQETNSTPVFNQLVWSDEFNTNGEVDSVKWFHQTLLPSGGNWYNGEIQHYTDRIENSVVYNGILKIIAKKETFSDQGYVKDYTSARLNSKFAFKYGKVVIRAKLPSGIGTWPAIWTLGKNINEDGAYFDLLGYGTTSWPACGEIDIMEHWGSNQNYVQSATHTPSSYGGTVNLGGRTVPTASTDFHIYSLEWTSEKLVFSVDSIIHYTYNPPIKNASTWPFDAEQYLLLNIAVLPSIAANFSSSAMEIDYVRIYQESNTSVNANKSVDALNVFPNPFLNNLNIVLSDYSDGKISAELYNIQGQIVKSYVANNKVFVLYNLAELSKGIYLLRINIGDKVYTRKLYKK
jgi:beta-glucanase (GH16 family)